MTDQQQLQQFLLARHACISICTYEEQDALELVRGVAVEMQQQQAWLWSNSRGLRDGLIADGPIVTDTEHPVAALNFLIRSNTDGIVMMLDLAGHLKEPLALRLLRDLIDKCTRQRHSLILIDQSEELPPCIRALATPLELSLPNEQQLDEILRCTLREERVHRPIEVSLNAQEFSTVLRNLNGLTARQARRIISDALTDDARLDYRDINRIIAAKRQQFQGVGLLEYVESPVDLEEIGGLVNLKRWLAQRQEALSPNAVQFGLSAPRGVLMLGVQGAGKSLSAKAVATAWGRPLMRLDPGVLYDRYIGESERRLRDALKQAEVMAPIILWIDEIEKGFASAASASTDGGLSKRMLGTLLTWLQEHTAPVFTIATANDIEALPPELLRKGRFDEIFFVDLPTLETRAQIFAIHLRKRKRNDGQFDLAALAAASDGYTGAEIEQSIVSGLHEAFSAKTELTTQHILQTLQQSPPLSVTMAERVGELRQWSKGRCVPAE